MRSIQAIVAVALVITSAGCVFRGKQQTAKSVTPPPPPVVKTEPAPAPTPLSTPQTQVYLPPAQPVDPQALASIQLPGDSSETPVTPRPPARRVGPPAISPARPQAEPAGVPTVTPITPSAEEQRPPIGEIVPPSETKRLQDSLAGRKRDIKQLLDRAHARNLSRREQGVVTRIESFIKLSDQAEAKGDLREADALAERALVLAKDLDGGR